MAALNSTVSAGEVFALIASGAAQTRAALGEHTGLSRSTLAERLEVLFAAELIREGEHLRSSGGRPSRVITLNTDRHVILAADVGEDHVRVIVSDVGGTVLGDQVTEVALSQGPQRSLAAILDQGLRLVTDSNREVDDLIGIALSLPAPVDFVRAQVAGPSVMTGWDGVSLEALVRERLDVPVVIENDVNARGLGEYLSAWREYDEVFYVKAGTGIGSAIISAGSLFRGANGAAGDIGHIRLRPDDGPLCRCGAVGCVEAIAAGWSLVRDLRERGVDVADTRAAMGLVAANSPVAIHLLREAGRTLGQAVAYCVSLLNPDLIVIGGSLTGQGQHLISGIRESVYQYAHPLATRDLAIMAGRGGEQTGAIGAAHLVIDRVLTAERVNEHLRSRGR